MKDLSLYIHIPFCVRKCLYCDFLSFPVPSGSERGKVNSYVNYIHETKQGTVESYVNLLCREITAAAAQYEEYRVLSIFFGGGTPSLLPVGEVSRITDTVRECYRVSENAEITTEMNPDTVSEDKLREYITSGINRLSIGLQSADDDELERIGRIHDYRTFVKAYETARRVGFRNINIDLMAALPEQSVSSYEWTLRQAVSLMPEHISAYSLTLEEGTPLYGLRERYRFPAEEEDREMYALTGEYLASCGYHRYEISNYALEGYECRHNKVYWQRGNYVGFGLGAASMVENVRWTDPADMEKYRDYAERLCESRNTSDRNGVCGHAAEIPAADRHILTRREQMEEYMFLGLRMMCGVGMREFEDIFGIRMQTVYGGIIEKLGEQGLLTQDRNRIKLTLKGIDVSNYVMAQFLLD